MKNSSVLGFGVMVVVGMGVVISACDTYEGVISGQTIECGDELRVDGGAPVTTSGGPSGSSSTGGVPIPNELPVGCGFCETSCAFSKVCTSVNTWCGDACDGGEEHACPEGMRALFCQGEPPIGACMVTNGPSCGGDAQVYCCTADLTAVQDSCEVTAECPPPQGPCMQAMCAGNICHYEFKPNGADCGDNKTCFEGGCF